MMRSSLPFILEAEGTFFLRSNTVSGPYLLGIGTLISLYEGNRNFSSSKHVFSASGGLGYQWRVGPAFVLRTEGRYRRWIDDGENEFSLFPRAGHQAWWQIDIRRGKDAIRPLSIPLFATE